MYSLQLNARKCICCGICFDACDRQALGMRLWKARSIEGVVLSYAFLGSRGNREPAPLQTETFPYLQHAERCDGCAACVRECPAAALDLQQDAVPQEVSS